MWADLRAAFSLLTIFPFGYAEGRKPGWAFAYYPLVGGVVGAALAIWAALSPFPPNVSAVGGVVLWVLLTGGLHLDGFADACDGLFATTTPARRLEIMKDPRTGAWAVIGLVLLLLLKAAAMPHIAPWLLILPPVMGRWVMVLAAWGFPYARPRGMGAFFRDGLGRTQAMLATGFALALMAAAARDPLPVLLAGLCGVGVLLLLGQWAANRLGGHTGDVYGFLCELSELACLLVLIGR